MSNTDTLFLKVINDGQLVNGLDINPSRIRNLSDGKRSVSPQVRAIAETIELLSKKVDEAKRNMRLTKKEGSVVLSEADFQSIYKKVVALLSK